MRSEPEWKKGDVVQDPLGRVWERNSRYLDPTYVWRDFTGGWVQDEALPRPLIRLIPDLASKDSQVEQMSGGTIVTEVGIDLLNRAIEQGPPESCSECSASSSGWCQRHLAEVLDVDPPPDTKGSQTAAPLASSSPATGSAQDPSGAAQKGSRCVYCNCPTPCSCSNALGQGAGNAHICTKDLT